MSIEGINWDTLKGAMVVHVFPGTTSPDLRVKHLRFHERLENTDLKYPFAKEYLDDPDNAGDVALTFTIADGLAAPGTSTRDFSAHGITLNGATGQVTVAATLTDPFPQNFHLEVQAVSGGKTYRELIRVEIHRSIEEIWLTPNPLRLRPRRTDTLPVITRSRFSLRARFDDGLMGDLTDWSEVAWTPSSDVTNEGRLIVAAGNTPGTSVTIHASLPQHPSVPQASASVQMVDTWGPDRPIETRLVPGGGWPNPLAIEAVPNVLFLVDGLTDTPAARSGFHAYVNSLVRFLKNNVACKPYDVLASSMNFWAAFIPSPQPGVTWASEVFGFTELMPFQPHPVFKPERPNEPVASAAWGTAELVYHFGLPKRGDASRSATDIVSEWDALHGTAYRARLGSAARRTDSVNRWRQMASRSLLDDIDSPLGIRSGAPRADAHHNLIGMNNDRLDRERLDDLLLSLRHDRFADSGLDLSTLWVKEHTRAYDLICIITPNSGRAANYSGYFIVNQDDESRGFSEAAGGITVGTHTFSSTPESSHSRLLAHELSHSFNLGDEYGGDAPDRVTTPKVNRAQKVYPNLQNRESLLRGSGASALIHGDEVKWRWPRIRWAAEVIGPPTPTAPNVFEVPIRASHAFAFPIGEVVFFRFRDIDYAYREVRYGETTSYLVKPARISVPLRLVDTLEIGSPTVVHLRLRVDPSVPFDHPAAETIAADAIATSVVAGYVVYQPTRAPNGVFNATTYPYAELIAKNVKDLITSRGDAVGDSDGFPEVPDFEGLSLPDCYPSAYLPAIVALYHGGLGNDTGMFHPTGNCMMSNQRHGEAVFCHVCRYALVDAIDPSKHYFIDRDYAERYPQE